MDSFLTESFEFQDRDRHNTGRSVALRRSKPLRSGSYLRKKQLLQQHDSSEVLKGGAFNGSLPRRLRQDEIAFLTRALFGTEVDPHFDASWINQKFEFSRDFPFVLLQGLGGPCGVIAALQAYLMKHLLWPDDRVRNSEVDIDRLMQMREHTIMTALMEAIYEILRQAFTGQSRHESFISRGANSKMMYVVGKVDNELPSPLSELQVYEFDNNQALGYFLGDHCNRVCSSGPIGLLISLLLTRGEELFNIDSAKNAAFEPLLDSWQGTMMAASPAVQFILTGRHFATLPEEFEQSRGSTCGFLSAATDQTARFLTSPIYPVWVLHGSDHFLTVFSPSIEATREIPEGEFTLYQINSMGTGSVNIITVRPGDAVDDNADERLKRAVRLRWGCN